MKILLATTNDGKLKEMKELFSKAKIKNLELISLNDLPKVEEPVEDGHTFFDNAYIKAVYYFNKFRIPTISDDSGLLVKALNYEPGIRTARYAMQPGEKTDPVKNYTLLLSKMEGKTDRRACFKTSMLFYDGKILISSEGKMYGLIADAPSGKNGFGYDPIFYIPKFGKTVGCMTDEEKNKISHRAKASKVLIEKLEVYF